EGAEPAAIVAPASWLERLIAVLIDNAQRYTPVGGAIRVVVSGGEGAALLRVEDSGPGIPEAESARVFDRFHRASGEPGGSGLGLAIADAIVTATHGRWEVGSSAELGGASFTVRWAQVRRSGEAVGALRMAD
ncbi:MAG: sensor histidine kinase, partial [Candidatus Dormiibacterota bacterium]